MTVHRLKSWPHLFIATLEGRKKHDMRINDRPFRVGDTVVLEEFDPDKQSYSGRSLTAEITYITSPYFPCAESGHALSLEYCVLSLELQGEAG